MLEYVVAENPDARVMRRAASVLRDGGLVVSPTDTSWSVLCSIASKDGIAALPAYPTESVIDPTGAGDSFAGGMMGHIASQGMKSSQATSFNTLRESLAHGTVVASFNIESFSLERLAKLTRPELDKRYTEYVSMVRV